MAFGTVLVDFDYCNCSGCLEQALYWNPSTASSVPGPQHYLQSVRAATPEICAPCGKYSCDYVCRSNMDCLLEGAVWRCLKIFPSLRSSDSDKHFLTLVAPQRPSGPWNPRIHRGHGPSLLASDYGDTSGRALGALA
ncbi:hypothetical protein JAAARDRAFT_664892 [Jaapia argillacea MUCL 33604]|uniref:Uncharacterized protein n=1 Tax=Jaapia argillacea MUCL 33604 TaxID=933084 RepID=A0A067PUA8_9AGAM|nr:hypothetical protein JAAARDRAFT_664892 [Jaapia argillacea MUCL 33604]